MAGGTRRYRTPRVLIWCAKNVVRTYGTALLDNIGLVRARRVGGSGALVARGDTRSRARERGGGRSHGPELEVGDGEASCRLFNGDTECPTSSEGL
jgi:hypothetical protein